MRDLKGRSRYNLRYSGRKRLKLLGVFLLFSIFLILLTVLFVRKGSDAVASHSRPSAVSTLPDDKALFPLAFSLLPQAREAVGGLSVATDDGTLLRYSIDPRLQQSMQQYFEKNRPPYALFIALEPATGRIISLAAASQDPSWKLDAAYRLFPMASLFKIVTAAAALEQSKITPFSQISYRGSAISENPGNWDPRPKRGCLSMDLTEAMAKSVNPVYGKLASDLLGKDALAATCSNFGFNRPLVPGIPAQPSRAEVPETVHGLRLMGSGLDHELKVSPLHAAAITAAIANNGLMMTPRLVDSMVLDGKETPLAPPSPLTRVVKPGVADSLRQMLLETVRSGTCRKAFRTYDGRRLLSVMQVAAKTGSITGDDPAGHYSWFTAFAPAEKPQVAVLALVINDGRWKIKASNVGEHALTTFFRDQLAQAPALPVVVPERKSRELRGNRTEKTHPAHIVRKKNGQSSHRGKAA